MCQPKNKRAFSPTWIWGGGALVVTLLWSISLIGGGIWKLTRQSVEETSQSEPTYFKDFTEVPNVPSGLFRYTGSPAWAPIRLSIDSPIQAERPEFRLQYIQPDNGPPSNRRAIAMLLDDRVAFVQSSIALQPEDRHLAVQNNISLQEIPIAIDSIVAVVNPNLNVSGLTLEQLRSIYTGQIVNWKEVGGPDLAIVPFSRPSGAGGKIDFFVENVLMGQEFGSNVKFFSTPTEALRELANHPGAIYYASASVAIPQCDVKPLAIGRSAESLIAPYKGALVSPAECPARRNQVNLEAIESGNYPITLYLYAVVKQDGGIDEQAGRAYANFLLSDRAGQLLERAGFIPIR
jgi:phosphate transport system substrate-binding protein